MLVDHHAQRLCAGGDVDVGVRGVKHLRLCHVAISRFDGHGHRQRRANAGGVERHPGFPADAGGACLGGGYGQHRQTGLLRPPVEQRAEGPARVRLQKGLQVARRHGLAIALAAEAAHGGIEGRRADQVAQRVQEQHTLARHALVAERVAHVGARLGQRLIAHGTRGAAKPAAVVGQFDAHIVLRVGRRTAGIRGRVQVGEQAFKTREAGGQPDVGIAGRPQRALPVRRGRGVDAGLGRLPGLAGMRQIGRLGRRRIGRRLHGEQRPRVLDQRADHRVIARLLGRGRPQRAGGRAERGPALQLPGQPRVGVLGIDAEGRHDLGRREQLACEVQVDLALVRPVFAQPHRVALGRHVGRAGRRPTVAPRRGGQARAGFLDVVVAPVKTFGVLEPFGLAAAVQFALAAGQREQRDFVALQVAHHPLGGAQAVVVLRQQRGSFVDAAGVLLRLADARGQRRAAFGHRALVERGFGQQHAGFVDRIVHAAVHAAGRGLHHEAVAGGGLDLHPHVVEVGRVQVVHGDVAKHNLPIRRGRAVGDEGVAALRAALSLVRPAQDRVERLLGGDAQVGRVGGHQQRVVQGVDLVRGVEDDDVQHVQRPPVGACAGGVGALHDALHLLHLLGRKAFFKQTPRHRAVLRPGCARRLRAPELGQRADVGGDLGRHQVAVLQAAFARRAFDVNHRPTGLRVAPARAPSLHGGRVGREPGLGRRRRVGGGECQPRAQHQH